jgi:hypothetical protein
MPQRVVIVRALFRDGRYLGLVVTRKPDYLVDDFVDSVLHKAEAAGMVMVDRSDPDRPIVEWKLSGKQ